MPRTERSIRPRRLRVLVDAGATEGSAPAAGDAVICLLDPPGVPRTWRRHDRGRPDAGAGRRGGRFDPTPLTDDQWFWQQLVRVSGAIARETLPRGGVLLHSGLAACPDPSGTGSLISLRGVLLAGRSGVGKSTASRRLPPPWRALADDATLIVRDGHGAYWAHPWPTWSRFFGEERGDGSDTWDVQAAVPLRAILILEQGEADQIDPLGSGHAVALLAELAQQTSKHLLRDWPVNEIGAFNLQCFENLCDLVRAVPAYLLYAKLDGAFWAEIERVL
jgi:SynChlorMet cassette protein ScmC